MSRFSGKQFKGANKAYRKRITEAHAKHQQEVNAREEAYQKRKAENEALLVAWERELIASHDYYWLTQRAMGYEN